MEIKGDIMIDQRSKRLLLKINEIGCYFLTLAEIVSREYEYNFEPEQINAAWEMSVKRGYIKDDLITSPDSIIKMLKDVSGTTKTQRIFQIGQTLNGFTEFWQWAKKYTGNKVYTAAMEKTGGKYGTHFILVQSYENPIILYDSWNLQRCGEKTKAQRFIYYAVIE